MNTSDFYDLNLVEGSDKFNPLIVDVPNYEKIDEVMHDNAVASVGVATEILAGSVHAITRANGDAPMFRFTATSNFNIGETFSVDGVQVTALTPSGEVLGSGAFVIGTTVLACLVGSTMTVFTSSSTAEAYDSQRLGGQLPSYYGTAEGVQSATELAQASGVIAQSAQSKATEVEGAVSTLATKVLKLVYTNPNPTSGASTGFVYEISDKTFDLYIVNIKRDYKTGMCGSVMVRKGEEIYFDRGTHHKIFAFNSDGNLYIKEEDNINDIIVRDIYGIRFDV